MTPQRPRSAVFIALTIAAVLTAGCSSAPRGRETGASVAGRTSSSARPNATTPPPASSAPSTAENTLLPADSTLFPAKGCGPALPDLYVAFEIAPDGTHPDCLIVAPQQRLRVFNNTNGFPGVQGCTGTVTLARFPTRTLVPGQTTTFDEPFSSFFTDGEHVLHISCGRRDGAGVIIWLK